jgi:hypothetical protein
MSCQEDQKRKYTGLINYKAMNANMNKGMNIINGK